MPLYKTINLQKGILVYVWKITEHSNEFSNLDLTEDSEIRVKNMKSEQHKRGFLSVRKLLNIAGYQDQDLYYLESGKPCLTGHQHISISHAQGFATIAISNAPVGIDVEKLRIQLFKIKHKFLNQDELKWVSKKENLELLTVLWCCKESIYKIYPHSNLALKDITINNFELKSRIVEGKVLKKGKIKGFKLFFEFIEDHVLAYVKEQIAF